MDYLRDPQEIYARSFAIIRAEAPLDRLPEAVRPMAMRIVHACGMIAIMDDLVIDERLPDAARSALSKGAAVFADCQAVKAGIIARRLPVANEIVCTLDDPRTAELARERRTTRSAAAVELWDERLGGAVAVIGNAPTALFALLEAIDAGRPRPAAIIAMPVGFVGAAESKAELVRDPRGIPFATVLGRRGGSAMASAALNALLAGAE